MRTPIFLLAATSLIATGVAEAQVAPSTLNPRDVAEAAKEHPALVEEFGGAETGPRAAYVERIGRKVAAYSGTVNAGQAYHFTTLNSAVENAFAVPGGYVYITRQLMGLMNDEAELAFVVGHESGHVAANHSRKRQAASQRNSVLGVLGVLVGSVVGGGFGNLISQSAQYGSQLRTLGFSRDQEYQADQLGIRYIAAAGYDPMASATMLSALGRATALESRIQGKESRSTPEWASTHPLSANRVQQASATAQRTGRAGVGLRNRDAFLAQLNGVTVDDDPAQGIIEGRDFIHPDLRLKFTVPTGYLMQNSARAVTIEGSAGKAQFAGGSFTGDPSAYIQRVVYGLTEGKTQIAMSPVQQTTINGIPAFYSTGRAQTSNGVIDLSVMAYQWDRNTMYHFVTLTRGGQGLQPFATLVDSLRRITPAEASAIKPRIIQVHTVVRGDTAQSLANRMAYRDYKLDRFLSLNGLETNAALVPGQKVKLVVYGARRG